MANDDSILREINSFPMHYMKFYVLDYKSTDRTGHDRAAMRSTLIERETSFWSHNIADSAKLKVIEYFDSHPGAAHHAEELVSRAANDESTLVMYADGRQETRGQHEQRLGAETAREGLHVAEGNFLGAMVLGVSQLIHPDPADALHHAEPFITASELLMAHGEASESRAHINEIVHAGLGYDGPSPLIPGIGGYEAGIPHPIEHEAVSASPLSAIPEPGYSAGTASAQAPSLAGDRHDLRDSGASTGHGHTAQESSSHHSMALPEHRDSSPGDAVSGTPGSGHAAGHHGGHVHPADGLPWVDRDYLLSHHNIGGAHPPQHEPATAQHHGMSLVEHIETHTPPGSDSVPPHDATPHHSNTYDQHLANEHAGH